MLLRSVTLEYICLVQHNWFSAIALLKFLASFNIFNTVNVLLIYYSKLRIFLDRLADLSKEKEYYPDISFGVTYANITVYASDAEVLSDEDKAFSHSVDELI